MPTQPMDTSLRAAAEAVIASFDEDDVLNRVDALGALRTALAAEQAKPDVSAEVEALRAENKAFRKELDLTVHKVITCGVAATHPDANLSRTGAYAGKWNSGQAEDVRILRDERDALRVEVARLQAQAASPENSALPDAQSARGDT